MSNKTISWLKISGTCGIITPLVAFSCILLAIAYAPHFSWTDDALSNLGVMQSPTSTLFNLGLIAGGILGVFFASGLLKLSKGKLPGQIGALMFVLDCLALTAIGIFPENAEPMHHLCFCGLLRAVPIVNVLHNSFFHSRVKEQNGTVHFLYGGICCSCVGCRVLGTLRSWCCYPRDSFCHRSFFLDCSLWFQHARNVFTFNQMIMLELQFVKHTGTKPLRTASKVTGNIPC